MPTTAETGRADRFRWLRYLSTAARLGFDAFREGRLSASPRRWLIDLRHLRGLMSSGGQPLSSRSRRLPTSNAESKQAIADAYRLALAALLASTNRLRFDQVTARPKVSVLVVLFNRAELTLRCFRSLLESQAVQFEVVIVDNNSSDDTSLLLDRVDGAHIIRNADNIGFLHACNLAADSARGEYLLFLNSDAELLPGSLAAALHTIQQSPAIGAVGGRLILPGGQLQEAGSIVWRDGSCLGYGRGDSPWAPEYAFTRDVDYCSAALLLTPRALFLQLGGFDDRFAPAYYEDVDYCVRLWQSGKRVVYEPRVQAVHVEFASSPSFDAAIRMQQKHRMLFVEKHRDWLQRQYPSSTPAVVHARARPGAGLRILVVDDRVPRTTSGFGFPRAVELIRSLVELGHFVTLYTTAMVSEDSRRMYDDIPPTVEALVDRGPTRIVDFFRHERAGYFDRVIVSRPHNMQLLRAKLGLPRNWLAPAKVIYDAEAIATVRDVGRRQLAGEHISEAEVERLVAEEVALAEGADAVLAVSTPDAQRLAAAGLTNIHTVGYLVRPAPTGRPFDERRGALFVGAFHELSPNADAVLWFARYALPQLRAALGNTVPFTVVGHDPPADVLRLRDDGVKVVAGIQDLTALYDEARIFIAPIRFAAGIPLKIVHAAAHGLPIVATSLLARQLQWHDGQELLVADTADDFATACSCLYSTASQWHHVRAAALERLALDYSRERFVADLETALG